VSQRYAADAVALVVVAETIGDRPLALPFPSSATTAK